MPREMYNTESTLCPVTEEVENVMKRVTEVMKISGIPHAEQFPDYNPGISFLFSDFQP